MVIDQANLVRIVEIAGLEHLKAFYIGGHTQIEMDSITVMNILFNNHGAKRCNSILLIYIPTE